MKKELISLIADDAFAISFQTMGQYRSALIKWIKSYNPTETENPPAKIEETPEEDLGPEFPKCPKCKSQMLMEHRFDDSYKICMRCQHNFRC